MQSRHNLDKAQRHFQGVRLATLPKVPNHLGGTKERGILLDRPNKEITLRRGITEEMRVVVMTALHMLGVEGSTSESAEWELMPTICAVRRGITSGTVT